MRVKGIQTAARMRSDKDKLIRNTLVTVRMRRFCMSVTTTRALPTTARTNMREYKEITICALVSIGGGPPAAGGGPCEELEPDEGLFVPVPISIVAP